MDNYSPLGDLDGAIGQVLGSAGYNPKPYNPYKAAAEGAAIGVGSAIVWHQMKKRKAAKGEYTHPYFRFFLYFWAPVVLGFISLMGCLSVPPPAFGNGNQAVTQGWVDLGVTLFFISVLVGLVWSWGYLIYRATGHGRYNSRRTGSPWRGGISRGTVA